MRTESPCARRSTEPLGAFAHGLHLAAAINDADECARLARLQPHNIDIYEDGATPLLSAIFHGSLESVRALLIAGASLDVRDKNGSTLLHLACCHRPEIAEPLVELLLSRARCRGDVHAVDRFGSTPLHAATVRHPASLRVVSLLLQSGADPVAQDCGGRAPLHMGIRFLFLFYQMLRCCFLLVCSNEARM